jgi:hypothetical protein
LWAVPSGLAHPDQTPRFGGDSFVWWATSLRLQPRPGAYHHSAGALAHDGARIAWYEPDTDSLRGFQSHAPISTDYRALARRSFDDRGPLEPRMDLHTCLAFSQSRWCLAIREAPPGSWSHHPARLPDGKQSGGLGLRRPWTNYRLLARSILINVNYAPPRPRCAHRAPAAALPRPADGARQDVFCGWSAVRPRF